MVTCFSRYTLFVRVPEAEKKCAYAAFDDACAAIARYAESLREPPWLPGLSRRQNMIFSERRRVLSLQRWELSRERWCLVESVNLRLFSPRGKSLDMHEAMSRGNAALELARSTALARRWLPYSGFGPVPRISRRRSRWYRGASTAGERRANALVLTCEGEVAARPSRRRFALPDSRDDLRRCDDYCWKAQFKGRKAWDR